MLAFLKDHPFAVDAFFESSLVLTYAVPKKELEHLIPDCLVLDTFRDEWAFIAVAMVKTKNLRPAGFPGIFGNDFFLTGYRIFVRYTTSSGKRLRGLYILKSETDKKKMTSRGNIFTHYKYTTTDIEFSFQKPIMKVVSQKSRLKVEVRVDDDAKLPAQTPFADWAQARRFAGPLPFTFTYNEKKKEVLMIEGVRENWKPTPVQVIQSDVGFINDLKINAVLANAFVIRGVPYHWKKGKKDIWNG
jgi:hypothetical protein